MTQQPDVPAPAAIAGESCPHCQETVPVGAFCGNCGASLTDPNGFARVHAYAAAPGERVARPAVVSTLFAHLPHRHAHVFREALGIGVLVVILLAALRLYTSALIAAALLLPILYLLYMFEVQVYQSEPVAVAGSTFVLGAALGAGYQVVSAHYISGSVLGTQQGPLISGVVMPFVAQVLMLAGPAVLLSRSSFDETLDGLTFGVCSALGFTLASVIAGYWHVFTAPLQGSESISTDEILRLLRAGILVAVVNAATTGMITAVLWLAMHARAMPRRHQNAARGLLGTLLVAFGAQILLGVAGYYMGSLLGLVLLWAFGGALLLVWLRVLIHNALLDERGPLRIGALAACPECHRLVPSMTFCPACGVHRSAAPRRSRLGAHAPAPRHG